jgi:hypothetical protein
VLYMTEAVSSKELMEALAAPFSAEDIEWRTQSASDNNGKIQLMIVPYLDSRAVMNRLDQVCGTNWQTHFDKIEVGGKEAFQCRLSIRIDGEWITRTDAAESTDRESVKGGHSNALKRAAVQWGIGRYLYDCPKFWVPLLDRGEHRVNGDFKIRGNKKRLTGYFNTPSLPAFAMPSGEQPGSKNKSQQPPKINKRQEDTKQSDEQQRLKALEFVIEKVQYLNIPNNYLSGMIVRFEGYQGSLKEAPYSVLNELYKVLNPVAGYVKECRKYQMTDDELLDHAQITLKVELKSIHAMYFKMNADLAKETLELIKHDRQMAS